MNRILLTAISLLSLVGFSQPITVSTTSHTVPQLVNDVLINSPCVSASNVTWRTGTNYGSVNGIGFFTNTNPNFPMPGGVILSTGNALNAVGPNTSELNDGTALWAGDADLEQTLAAAGISMSSVNATVLEFDFLPISSHFNFDFVFASEEYGNFQCQYSDAFAFLLTNMNTGVTTNLAVVPNTNQPISVVTIRDFLYNSSCGSANPQYFGSFNGGSAAAGSATNFNGQTVLLNASAVLVPNTPYHIKLVIADRSDSDSDSAIFISSDSFNIGQDVLGLDLTVAAGTAICPSQSHVLATGLNPAEYSMTWTRNGVTIPNETGPSLTITQPGTYGITYVQTTGNCVPVTDHINVEFYPQYNVPNPQTLYRCGSGQLWFDLSLNTPVLSQGVTPAPVITYHDSQASAEAGTNALALNYSSAGNQTIYARVKNPATGCYVIKTFQLEVTSGVTANSVDNQVKCARSLSLINNFFNFTTLIPQILGSQSTVSNTVSFHLTLPDANAGINPIPNPQHFLAGNQTIYARVQNVNDTGCFAVTSFNTEINPLPPIQNFPDRIVCENFILPELAYGAYYTGLNGTGEQLPEGTVIDETSTIYIFNQDPDTGCRVNTDFKITVIDPEELAPADGTYCGSYTLPPLQYGKYYPQPGGQGTPIPAGTVINSTQTLYYYYQTTIQPFCAIDTEFTVTILPKPELPALSDIFACESYVLPPLSVGKYFTGPNGTGFEIPAGSVITTTSNIYVYAETDTVPMCSSNAMIKIIIGFDPPSDIVQCDPYVLPNLPVGNYYSGPNGTGTLIPAGTAITGTTTVYLNIPNSAGSCAADIPFNIMVSQPPVDTLSDVSSCDSYELPELTHGNYYTGPNGSGEMLVAGDIITESKTIYIFDTVGSGCSNESSFNVTINPLPAIDSRSDIDVCHSYTLTPLEQGNYYTGPGGTGTMLPAGTVLTESQIIYIYATNGTCSIENQFEVYIFTVEADSPAPATACDSYVLPALTIGNYYTLPGGPSTPGQSMKHAGDVITETTTLYIYTEAGDRIICSDENVFTITINITPVIDPMPAVRGCDSYTLPALAIGNYYMGPNGTGTMLHAGDVITEDTTLYVYAATATNPVCWAEQTLVIDIFNVDELPDTTICENFTLPTLTVGKYYTGPNGTGTQLPAGTNITTSQTIYIYAQSPFTPVCSDESSFVVTIVDQPVANVVPMSMTTFCDEDGVNDGITNVDLTSLTATVLGTQSGPEFSVTYHTSFEDANTGSNPVTTTTANSVYVRVTNSLAPSCFALRALTIKVNKLPEPTPLDGIICYDVTTGTLLNGYTIHSGLSAASHQFQWRDENGTIVGTGSYYTATAPGVYTVTAMNYSTGCMSQPVSVTVTPSAPAIVAYEITEAFADNQSITVIATGTGDYEYQLDNGEFQDSNIFYDVAPGIHVITVRDKNGCGATTSEALVINYPKFFTPNGDGHNDTWNIKDLRSQDSAVIEIYDRYGKFIKQIKPSGEGWDGTYHGNPMPSTDYWFVVHFTDDEQQKREFRAHFAMKR